MVGRTGKREGLWSRNESVARRRMRLLKTELLQSNKTLGELHDGGLAWWILALTVLTQGSPHLAT